MDCIVHGVANSRTQHSLTHFRSKGWVAPSGALSYTVKSHLSTLQDECVCVCNLKSCSFFSSVHLMLFYLNVFRGPEK